MSSASRALPEGGVNPRLPTWSGARLDFSDYERRCLLEFDGTKPDERKFLAPRLAANLRGTAWALAEDLERDKLKAADGCTYFLEFMKKARGPHKVDALGESFENFFGDGMI